MSLPRRTLFPVTRGGTLLEEIESAAHDGGGRVADALRRCITLGGRAGSTELRDWANHELNGYYGEDDLPDYRTVGAPIGLDGAVYGGYIKNQQISPYDLPDFVRGVGVSEQIKLRQGIGELEELARDARSRNEPVKMLLPEAATIAKYMNSQSDNPYQSIQSIYWAIASTTVFGVVDAVRNRLVSLVAELRAEAADANAPTGKEVSSAVNVAVYGRKSNVTVTAAQSTGGGPATATTTGGDQTKPWWRRAKTIGGVIVGIAGIATAIIAWLQFAR